MLHNNISFYVCYTEISILIYLYDYEFKIPKIVLRVSRRISYALTKKDFFFYLQNPKRILYDIYN